MSKHSLFCTIDWLSFIMHYCVSALSTELSKDKVRVFPSTPRCLFCRLPGGQFLSANICLRKFYTVAW